MSEDNVDVIKVRGRLRCTTIKKREQRTKQLIAYANGFLKWSSVGKLVDKLSDAFPDGGFI